MRSRLQEDIPNAAHAPENMYTTAVSGTSAKCELVAQNMYET